MAWGAHLARAKRWTRDTFPTPAIYAPKAGGGPHAVTVIFDAAHESQEFVDGQVVTTVGPALDLVLADLPVTPAIGDLATVSGATYRVVDVRPDGGGMALLVLNRI